MTGADDVILVSSGCATHIRRFDQSLAFDASASRNDFDEDDYDWSSQGYYHEDDG